MKSKSRGQTKRKRDKNGRRKMIGESEHGIKGEEGGVCKAGNSKNICKCAGA